jgi:hypothetical protein
VQSVQLELSSEDAGRQVAQVTYLLPRESHGAQGPLVGVDQLGGCGRAIPEEGGEATIDRPRSFRRELLAHDGANQGAVGVVGTPAAASRVVERADARDERDHDRVVAREQGAKACVPTWMCGLSSSALGGHPTGRRRAWRPGSSSPGSTWARR